LGGSENVKEKRGLHLGKKKKYLNAEADLRPEKATKKKDEREREKKNGGVSDEGEGGGRPLILPLSNEHAGIQ